jgi:erythromycin esterase-like protein
LTTYSGEVLAASGWGEDGEVHQVRPALNGMLALDRAPLAQPLDVGPLERAIGVVYLPATERRSH